MPDYNTLRKAQSRELTIGKYREVTGRRRLPAELRYWSLCALQDPNKPLCELEHVSRELNFIDREQYVGVDCGKDIVRLNRKRYPRLTFIPDWWVNALRLNDCSTMGFAHLDTVSFVDNPLTARLLVDTMLLAPEDCFIALNVIAKEPRNTRALDTGALLRSVQKQSLRERLMQWEPCGTFEYFGTGKTSMRMFMLYRPARRT